MENFNSPTFFQPLLTHPIKLVSSPPLHLIITTMQHYQCTAKTLLKYQYFPSLVSLFTFHCTHCKYNQLTWLYTAHDIVKLSFQLTWKLTRAKTNEFIFILCGIYSTEVKLEFCKWFRFLINFVRLLCTVQGREVQVRPSWGGTGGFMVKYVNRVFCWQWKLFMFLRRKKS